MAQPSRRRSGRATSILQSLRLRRWQPLRKLRSHHGDRCLRRHTPDRRHSSSHRYGCVRVNSRQGESPGTLRGDFRVRRRRKPLCSPLWPAEEVRLGIQTAESLACSSLGRLEAMTSTKRPLLWLGRRSSRPHLSGSPRGASVLGRGPQSGSLRVEVHLGHRVGVGC